VRSNCSPALHQIQRLEIRRLGIRRLEIRRLGRRLPGQALWTWPWCCRQPTFMDGSPTKRAKPSPALGYLWAPGALRMRSLP